MSQSKFIFRINPVGNQPYTTFPAKLESVGSIVKTMNNEKGTQYRNCTISFIGQNGTAEKHTALIYEKNYAHGMSVGREYLCRAQKLNDGSWIMTLSHLEGGALGANDDVFGFSSQTQVLPARGTQAQSSANLAKELI